jgi:UPF0755 protein
VTRREQEALTDYDPHAALFGDDIGDDDRDPRPYPATRAERRREERDSDKHHRRRSRRGWVIVLLTVLIVCGVGIGGFVVLRNYFTTKDWSGNGANYPVVSVTIKSGDSASDIAATLVAAGVVQSSKAFTDAASNNADSTSIQPGIYNVHQHQSAKTALAALLDSANRDASNDVLVTEGANVFAVTDRLVKVLGDNSRTAITQALSKPNDLNLPVGYTTASGKAPTSIEGFLYPATYTIDPGTKPTEALNAMVTRFIQADRTSNFAADAKTAGLSPYEALVVASIIQAEAKFDEDMPKVAEVIYNRLKAKTALQIDATTEYGCEIAGKSGSDCLFNNFPTPYNTYLHTGLPPTPIDNPGAQAMDAAVHPATGKLKFYVNGDAQGHLSFSTNESDFQRDVNKCRTNHWGCAG